LEKIVGAKPLSKNLLLQMDNCGKDNKNWHFLAFLSLLTTKDVFEEMKLGFLIVGHTHEDIDGCFSYMSKKLREQNNYVLVNLMKAFMVSQE
jgi:CO dehydrogenase nickel-insertion accessory protein CooC1